MRALAACMALVSIACSGAREVSDAGGDARIVLSCEQAMRAVGEPCDALSPTPPCTNYIEDCTTGRSGWESWSCEDGVVRYTDMLFDCTEPARP